MALEWLPIESAPKNGTVVLSDHGFVKWTEVESDRVIDCLTWYACDPNGELEYEYDNIQYSYPLVICQHLWLDILIPRTK